MNEKLKVLFENEILTEETKEALSDALSVIREEAISEAKDQLEVEYAKKMQAQKAELAAKLMSFVAESVENEIKELKEDLKRYAEELKELKEDLLEAKKWEQGKRLFEAFKAEFEEFGLDDDAKRIKAELEKAREELTEARKEIESERRARIMESLLSNLSGNKRSVMATLLENVDTDKLEKRYNEVLDSVMEDRSEETKTEESKKIVTEGVDTDSTDDFLAEVIKLAQIKE